MREIKFRAWNSIDKCMCDNSTTLTNLRGFIKSKHYHPMQYIGLKDKNGVEIYEGDIVEYKKTPGYQLETKRWLVEFDDCDFKWSVDYSWRDKVEVIGNIYQNQELLRD